MKSLKTSLYLVPTPIGNLGDITLRAIDVLKSVDFILAEDTRQTGKLLKHLVIQKKVYSHHKFNEQASTKGILDLLDQGNTCALVSDGGSPCISDPGFYLSRACIDKGFRIEALPGPTAFVPALMLSGLPMHQFVFEGFLPVKKGRKTRLEQLKSEYRTMIFYESPHRLLKTLSQFIETFGPTRRISVSRELTKMYEETQRGTAEEVISVFQGRDTLKGEFVVIVEGC
ncbi:MAG TPA: 16S rRNA (cytidine(1402)-2'-O)-methyltransferase [Bacteroidetes bacterium]|nr:16S rRNA (cytidine(1402)-2'-O)-methyltransferase [Bacteroidota bacterium]|tara:strand:+ start:1514 stop:2197 length:684 start_codon:yes stop_codon:yes gene_type:complete